MVQRSAYAIVVVTALFAHAGCGSAPCRVTSNCPVGEVCVATASGNTCGLPQAVAGEGEGEGEVLTLATNLDAGNAPLDVTLTWHVFGGTLSSCALHDASGQSADFALPSLDGTHDVTLAHSATFTVVCDTQSSNAVTVRVSRADFVNPPAATTQNSALVINWTDEEATCHIEGCPSSNVSGTTALVTATTDPTTCTLSCEGLGGTFTKPLIIRALILTDVNIAPTTVLSGGSTDVTFTSNDDAQCHIDIAPIGGTPTSASVPVSDGQGHIAIALPSSASVTVTCTLADQTLTSDATVVSVTPVITQFDAHASATDFTVLVSANGANTCTVQEFNAAARTGRSVQVAPGGRASFSGGTGALQYSATCVSADGVTTSDLSGPLKVLWGSKSDTNLGDVQFIVGSLFADGANAPQSLSSSSLLEVGGKLDVSNNTGSSTTVSLPALRAVGGDLAVSNNGGSTQATFAALTSIGGKWTATGNTGSASVSASALTTVGGDFEVANNVALQIGTNDYPSLTTVDGSFVVSGNTTMQQLFFASLVSVGSFVKISNNPAVIGLTLPRLSTIGGEAGVSDLAIFGNSAALSCGSELLTYCALNPRPAVNDVFLASGNTPCTVTCP